MKIYEIEVLPEPPISGEYDEVSFSVGGSCTFVRFTLNDGSQWVGVFPCWSVGGTATAVSGSTLACLVLCGGAFLVDAVERSLCWSDADWWAEDVVALPGRSDFLVHDNTRLSAIGRDGEVWNSGRVALDGISIVHVAEDYVEGDLELEMGDWAHWVLWSPELRFERGARRKS